MGGEPAGALQRSETNFNYFRLPSILDSESAFPWPTKNGIRLCARHSRKGNRMHRRNLMDRLDILWAALCIWLVRREFFPPDRSIRLVTWLSFCVGLPCPSSIRART